MKLSVDIKIEITPPHYAILLLWADSKFWAMTGRYTENGYEYYDFEKHNWIPILKSRIDGWAFLPMIGKGEKLSKGGKPG